ncbi:MAG: helix-turn-helix domain-containing protein [Acidimicrobiales bacterium]
MPAARPAAPSEDAGLAARRPDLSQHRFRPPGDAPRAGGPPAASSGQSLSDLLLLGALACQVSASLLSVPQPDGTWSTLCHGFETREGLNDGRFHDLLASATGPVEVPDLTAVIARSPLVLPPHSMRWAYGVALRDPSSTVVGVVAVLDRWLRQLTKREQRAMASLARESAVHLAELRHPAGSGAAGAGVPAQVAQFAHRSAAPAPGTNGSAGRDTLIERHQLLRSHEVAGIFDVTERTVINWAAAGKLPSLRTVGGHLRFRRDDVLRLLANASMPPPPR